MLFKLKSFSALILSTVILSACGASQMWESRQSGDWSVIFSNYGIQLSHRWENDYVGGIQGMVLGNAFESLASSAVQPRSYFMLSSSLAGNEPNAYEVTVSYYCKGGADDFKDSFVIHEKELGQVFKRDLAPAGCRPIPNEVDVQVKAAP